MLIKAVIERYCNAFANMKSLIEMKESKLLMFFLFGSLILCGK